jgi:hypothetical protein
MALKVESQWPRLKRSGDALPGQEIVDRRDRLLDADKFNFEFRDGVYGAVAGLGV